MSFADRVHKSYEDGKKAIPNFNESKVYGYMKSFEKDPNKDIQKETERDLDF